MKTRLSWMKRILALLIAFGMVSGMIPAAALNGIDSLLVGAADVLSGTEELDNGYIRVTVSEKNGGFGIRTVAGDKMNKSDNDKYLVYEYDGDNTSFTSFQVTRNGVVKEYIFGGTYPDSTGVTVTKNGDQIEAVWSVDDLTFTQYIRLVNTGSTEHGTVLISYSVENGGAPADIRCRLLVDTALGYQDYAYYRVSEISVAVPWIEKETELGKNGYEKSFYAVNDPDQPGIVAYTINASVDDRECVPYRTVFGHWNNIASTVFDYTPDETMTFTNFANRKYLTSDSAYAQYFDMGTVQTNGSAIIATNYGVYSNETMDEHLSVAVNVNAPDVIAYALSADGSENQSEYENGGKFEVKTHIKNISGTSYPKIRVVVTAAGCIAPLDQLGNPTDSSWDNPYTMDITDLEAGEQLDIDWQFLATPQEVGEYGKIQFKVYDVSDDATQNTGTIMMENLLGEGYSYILCPGSVSKMPELKFTASSPDTLFTEGVRTFNILGQNFSMLLDKSAYTLKVSRMDGKKINGADSFAIPGSQFRIDDTANVINVIFNEEIPGKLPEGMYQITVDYADASRQDVSGKALQFHVSAEEKYRNESYGFLAVVKDGTDYSIRQFADEDSYWESFDALGTEREDVLLEFRGIFIKEKTDDGSVVFKGVSNNKTHNVMTLNGCLDIRSGTCTVTEKDGSVTVDFDADIYTTGSGTYVHSGVAALTELERGVEYGLIGYDENGNREDAAGETIALLWPSAGEAFQNLMGLLFNFRYCELGVIPHEDSPTVQGSETRLAAFGAALDLSFLIPESVQGQYYVGTTGATKDALGSSYDAAEHNQISFSPAEIRALNKQADYRSATVNTNATQEDIDAGRFSDMTIDGTPGFNTLYIVVDDILFGGEYLGLNMEVGLGLPPYIANLPALEGVLSIHTVGDWAFGVDGQCHFISFNLEAGIEILNHNGFPIVDSLYFFVSGFEPGINIDGVGVLWLQGVQGGIENIYDTIFLTEKIPPIKLILGAQFSVLQLFNAYASMGISLSGVELSLTNGQFTEYTNESTGQVIEPQPITMDGSVVLQWYPEFYFHAAVNLALAQCIRGSGYIVGEESGFYEFFIRGSVSIPSDIPIIGGYEIAGIGMGVNTEKLWGKINYLSLLDIGVTYYWGGDIDWDAGSAATPTYPELLGDNAGVSLMSLPVGFDEETGETLYMAFGQNLYMSASSARTAVPYASREISDMITSDFINGSNHTMKLGQNGSGKILLIQWTAEDETMARAGLGEIAIVSNSDPAKTLPVRLWQKDSADDNANANFSYDPETGTAYLSIAFAADDTVVFGETWDITTMPGALLVVYDVQSLPEAEIGQVSVSGNAVSLELSGDGCEAFTHVTVTAEGKNNSQIYLLGNFEDPFGDGTAVLNLTLPEQAMSDTYTLRILCRDHQNLYYHEASAEIVYTNPDQPNAPDSVSAENAGDYKAEVAVSASGEFDGYQFTAYDSDGKAVNGVTALLVNKDGSAVAYDSSGAIMDAESDTQAESYLIGGRFEQSGLDEEGSEILYVSGFEAGAYTIEVRTWKKTENGSVLLSAPAVTSITIREPAETTLAVQVSGVNNSAQTTQTLAAGTEGEHTIPVFADSELRFDLTSFGGSFAGTWRIDGGFRDDLRGGITETVSTAVLNVSGLEEGQHSFTFRGVNEYGDSVSLSYAFAVDTLTPRMLLSSPVNGGLFDYMTGELVISGVTDADALLTVADRTTGTILLEKQAVNEDSDGRFETTVTLDRLILSHDLTITLSDALGNRSEREVSVMSNALGSIEKLMIFSDGKDITNTKLCGSASYSLSLMAKLISGKTREELIVRINDDSMIDWVCESMEGNAELTYTEDGAVLTVNEGAEGIVSARFLVSDEGAYSVSAAFSNNVEQTGNLSISGILDCVYGQPIPDVSVNTYGSDGTVSVYYYTNEACTEGKTAEKPVDAGTYWVRAEMSEGSGFSAALSNVLSFTIARADPETSVSVDDWTYGGTAGTPVVGNNPGEGEVTFLYKAKDADDSTYTDEIPVNAGEYTVKAVAAQTKNYNSASAECHFNILPKNIEGAEIAEIAGQIYTGEPIEPKPVVTDNGTALIENTDFTYAYADNVNAGEEAVVTIVGQGNYTGTAAKHFTIAKAPLTITVSMSGWSVDGEPGTPVVSSNPGGGTVTYTYKAKDADDSTYTAEIPTAVGTYTVKAVVAETANYKSAEATTDFAISDKYVQIITVSDVEAVYGDTGVKIAASALDGAKLTYTVTQGEDIVEADHATGELTIKKAGTAVVTVTAAETAEFASASEEVLITVTPRSISGAVIADIAELIYTGEPIEPMPGVRDGDRELVYGTDFTYEYKDNTDAGENAVVKVIGQGNYTGSAEMTFTIAKADLDSAVVAISGWVKGEQPSIPSVENNLGEGDVTYFYKEKGADDSTYTEAVPTEIGEYTVKAVIGETANYNGAEITADFVISSKPAQTITTTATVTAVYGDTGVKIEAAASGGGELTYTVKSGSDVVEVDPATGEITIRKAGTAVVTVTAAENADFAQAYADVTVTVETKKIAVPEADSAVYTYSGTEQIYRIAENDAYVITGNRQMAANETGYTVTVSLKDRDNYSWSDGSADDRIYTFVIEKAVITITVKDRTASVGDELPVLGEGDYTVTGLAAGEILKTQPELDYDPVPDMSEAGEFMILVSGAEAPDGSNYEDIVYVNGTLTVEKTGDTEGDDEEDSEEDSGEDSDDDIRDEIGGITVPSYYTITVIDSEGGTVRANARITTAKSPVSLTVVPDAGYELESLYVTGRNGAEIPLTSDGSRYSFRMPVSNVTVTASFRKTEAPEISDEYAECPGDRTCPMYGFVDLVRNNWYHDGIHFCLEEGMMQGTSGDYFAPNANTTRAMVVTILWRLEGKPSAETAAFTDVAANTWYAEPVAWASANGIVNGYGSGKFGPSDTITREQMAAIMYRYAMYKGYDVSGNGADLSVFSDADQISAWAVPAMKWACSAGLISGVGSDTLAPRGSASRAQTAVILYRFCEKVK